MTTLEKTPSVFIPSQDIKDLFDALIDVDTAFKSSLQTTTNIIQNLVKNCDTLKNLVKNCDTLKYIGEIDIESIQEKNETLEKSPTTPPRRPKPLEPITIKL